MIPSLSALARWNLESMTAASTRAGEIAAQLDDSMDRVVRSLDTTHWSGVSQTAADRRVAEEQDHAHEVRNVLQQIADESADAAADLENARNHVMQAVRAARDDRMDVSDTGVVTDPSGKEPEKLANHRASVAAALSGIGEIDELYGSRIADLTRDLASMVDGQPTVTIPGYGPIDADSLVRKMRFMSPEERRQTIAGMSDDDVRRLIQANPERIGNLDGIPFEHRITANEINIRNALGDEIQEGRGDGERAKKLREMLAQVQKPYETGTPAQIADATTERRFIAFENTHNGRFVEMFGEFGSGVSNSTVYVPGTGTSLNSSASNQRAAWNLATQTRGPVFLYVDGDLPQQIGHENFLEGAHYLFDDPRATARLFHKGLDDTAGDTDMAESMAHNLVKFGADLDTEIALHAPDATTTYIGHSYGGSIVGTAGQLGLHADNMIYASSAGTGIYDTPWADPDTRRYSLTFPGDFIQYVQDLPFNPHGGDPDDTPGITRLDTGSYVKDGVRHESGMDAHGAYWDDPDSTAFQNMVKVITGQQPDLYVHRHPDRVIDDVGEQIPRPHFPHPSDFPGFPGGLKARGDLGGLGQHH